MNKKKDDPALKQLILLQQCFGAEMQATCKVESNRLHVGSEAALGAAALADEGDGRWAGGQDTRVASEGAASSARWGAFDEAGPGHATAMAAVVSAAEGSHELGRIDCDARAEQAAPEQASVAAHQRNGAAPEQLPALGSADWHAAGCAGLPRPQARLDPMAAQPKGIAMVDV